MFRTIFYVGSDRRIAGLVRDALDELAEQSEVPFVRIAAEDVDDAGRQIAHRQQLGYDLLIIEAQLRAKRSARIDHGRSLGVDLLKEWRSKAIGLPAIMVGQIDNLLYRAGRELHPCLLLQVDAKRDLTADLARRLDELRNLGRTGAPDASAESSTNIEIALLSPQNQTYRIAVERPDLEINSEPMLLQLDFRRLRDLAEMTTDLNARPRSWRTTLRNCGEQIFDHLHTNPQFTKNYYSAVGNRRSLENVHIRFCVADEIHGAPFEAIYDPSRKQHLMLEAPITRRVDAEVSQHPLALDDDVNVLFIRADVGGGDYVPALDSAAFETLQNLAEEQELFRRIDVRRGEAKMALGEITVLPDDADPKSRNLPLREQVKNALTRSGKGCGNGYDIVHFAGHSYFEGKDRAGLIFPGKPPEVVGLPEFAGWLRKASTRFVYLSSCESSAAEVAFELAQKTVPAILGFRWDLDDDQAVAFAKKFYQNLFFECGAIERAFLQARQQMFSDYGDELIWAAPVLVLQTRYWGCLGRFGTPVARGGIPCRS